MYWPATRATFTTGIEAPYVSTTAICSSVRALASRWLSVLSANVSAQSPPCSRNARPSHTSASLTRSWSTSYGATIDGTLSSTWQTDATSAMSGHGGIWTRGRVRQTSRPSAASSAESVDGRDVCRACVPAEGLLS